MFILKKIVKIMTQVQCRGLWTNRTGVKGHGLAGCSVVKGRGGGASEEKKQQCEKKSNSAS
ncbi:UNVERIFIED_CONTAM: hypothetical protein FKN15_005376 [Acipenser sinensis]